MDEKKSMKPLDITKDAGAVDIPRIDVSEYIGKKAEIVNTTPLEGEYGAVLRVETVDLGPLHDANGDPVLIDGEPAQATASKLFGLKRLNDGGVGWVSDGKLEEFLKRMKVDHWKDLKGKTVTVQGQIKDDRTYLTFI